MESIKIPISKVHLGLDIDLCIYTLYKDDQPIYVGQTINLSTRLNAHKKDKDFDSFSFFLTTINDIDNDEAMQIVKLNPSQNKTLPSNDLFINEKVLVRLTSISVNQRALLNCEFNGSKRTGGLPGLNYVSSEFAAALVTHIDNFKFLKVEVK